MNQPKKQQISVSHQQIFQGPVPDPESLRKYESIKPGYADRLLEMAENEQKFRHISTNNAIEAEKELAKIEFSNYKRGQYLAITSVIIAFSVCVYALHIGAYDCAKYIAISATIGLAAVFLSKVFPRRNKAT